MDEELIKKIQNAKQDNRNESATGEDKVNTSNKEKQNVVNDNTTNPKDFTSGTKSNADVEASANPEGYKQKGGATTGDVSKETVRQNGLTVQQEKGLESKAMRHAKNTKRAGLLGFGLIAVTSIMDMSKSLSQDVEVSKMKNQQEANQRRKQQQEKDFQNTMSYRYIDWGQIPLDMFNQRLGHNKIGNAKYK